MAAMNSGQVSVKVIVVDDQAPFRRAMSDVVAATEGFELVAAAESAAAAEAVVEQQTPDLLFIDVRMPDEYGPVLAQRIRTRYPTVVIVLCSSYARHDVAPEIFDQGIAFLAKEDVTPDSIVALWRELHPDAA